MQFAAISFFTLLCISFFVSGQEKVEKPYHAGFMTLHIKDSSRVYKPGSLKTDKLHYRPLDLDIWYPSTAQTERALKFGDLFKLFEQRATAYQDETDYTGMVNELAQMFVAELGVGVDGKALLNVTTNSYENLGIAKGKSPTHL